MTLTEALFAVLILMGRGGGQQLSDYIPTEAYWQIKAIETDPATLRRLALAEAVDPASRLRRIMAIRTLGERREADAADLLRDAADSDDPAAAREARAALARVTGRPPASEWPDITAALRDDLALIPAGAAAVGGLRFVPAAAQPFDLDAALPDIAAFILGDDGRPLSPEHLRQGLALQLSSVIERVGDVRLDAVTIGVSGDLTADRMWAVAVIRGRWQRDRWLAMLRFLGRPVEAVDGVPVLRVDDRVSVALTSDERLVAVYAPSGETAAVAAVLKALAGGGPGPAGRPVFEDVDPAAPVWARVTTTESYRDVILFTNIRRASVRSELTPPRGDGPPQIDVQIDITGDDAVELEMDAGFVRSTVRSALAEVRRRRSAGGLTEGASIEALFASIKVEQDDARVRVTGTWPGGTGLLFAAPAATALQASVLKPTHAEPTEATEPAAR